MGLLIYDPRSLVAIQRRLSELHISYYAVSDSGNVGSGGIVIADSMGRELLNANNPVILIDVDSLGIDRAAGIALLSSFGLGTEANEIVIGIDVGRNIGMAVLADGELIYYDSSLSTYYIIDKVLWFANNVPCKNLVLRIGNTSGKESEALDLALRIVKALGTKARIEIVDERSSTSSKPLRYPHIKGDARAALNIALSPGGLVIDLEG